MLLVIKKEMTYSWFKKKKKAHLQTYIQLLIPESTIARSTPLTLGFQNENQPFLNPICTAKLFNFQLFT